MTTSSNTISLNLDSYAEKKLQRMIDAYKDGKMLSRTLQFQFFVMCASQVIKRDEFYRLSLLQISEYIKAVEIFTISEMVTIIQKLISQCTSQKQADLTLKKIIPKIRCNYYSYNLSPCCCENLYNFLSKTQCKLKNGNFYIFGNLFNFQSDRMLRIRYNQEKFTSPPRFPHSDDLCLVICNNSLEHIYGQLIKPDTNVPIFDTDIARPASDWNPDICASIRLGNIKSIQYNIFVLPLLRKISFYKGNSLVHIAIMHNQLQIIDLLYKLIEKQPIHTAKNKETIEKLVKCGCSFYDVNKSGQNLIDTMSDPFNENAFRYFFKYGFDIFKPNKNGCYWAQNIIRFARFYRNDDKENYYRFRKFLYQVLINNDLPIYKNNQNLQNILKKNEINETNDINSLRKAVIDRDINLIKTYLAIGFPADFKDENNITNLMIASQNGDIELVDLFIHNYCSVIAENNNGENSFWISAWNNHFDVSTLIINKCDIQRIVYLKSDQTILHAAYDNKKEELMFYLLDIGISPNFSTDKRESVIFKAFLNRDNKIAEIMQDDYKGEINNRNKNNESLGHIAIQQNDIKWLEYLLDRKLLVYLRDCKSQTLFMHSIIFQNNLQMSQLLLNRGADINAYDSDGNTPFNYVCSEKNFNCEKFRFLLKNGCNINIANKFRESPISNLIKFDRKEEALILINNNVVISDCESSAEPIVIALLKHSKFWVEKLVEKGANAMNKTFPVIEKYLDEEFFDFEILKKMKFYNITIGTPIQTALRNNKKEVAMFLWENASQNDRNLISKSLDINFLK